METIVLSEGILSLLVTKVRESKHFSKHTNEKCISVDLFGCTELTIINDELFFVDNKGELYSIWNGDYNEEDFIDIINSN